MQIKIGDKMHVAFSGSKYLTMAMELVPKEQLPIVTTIKKQDKRFVFT